MKKERHSKWFEIVGLDNQEEPVQIYFYKEIGSGDFDQRKICAEEFCRELDEIPNNRQVILRMNSRGGSFYDGLAIAHKIHDRGKVHCYIDGNCASAASVVAMACEKVIAGEGTSILIHNSRGSFENMDVNTLKDFVKSMEDVDLQMANIYARKSGKPLSDIQALMNRGERLTAEKALELGFVDEIKKITPSADGLPFAEDTKKSYIAMNEHEQDKINTREAEKENKKLEITAQNWSDYFPPMMSPAEAGLIYAKAKEIELKAEAKLEAMRVEKIIQKLNDAIGDRKIKNTSKGVWLEACLKDDGVLKLLDELPPMNYEPVEGRNLTHYEKLALCPSINQGVRSDSKSVDAYSSYLKKTKQN